MIYKTLSFLFLILFPVNVIGQDLNIDSLKKELENYIWVKSSNDWNAYTIKYMNKDSLVVYEIPYNRNGEIENDIWDLAFYCYRYDKKGRNIENRYYDIDGKLHFTDWPPIVKTEYDDKDRKIRADYFGEDEKLVSRFEYEYDEQDREIEFRDYNKDLKLEDITKTEYRDDGKIIIETFFDNQNKLMSNDFGVSLFYSKYLTNNREQLLEKRFLDADEKLVNITDKVTKKEYAKIVYSYGLRESWIKVEYFDSNNKFVGETWQYDPNDR